MGRNWERGALRVKTLTEILFLNYHGEFRKHYLQRSDFVLTEIAHLQPPDALPGLVYTEMHCGRDSAPNPRRELTALSQTCSWF